MGSYICSHKYQDLKNIFDGDYKKFLDIQIIKRKFQTISEAIGLLKNRQPLFCTETLKNAVRHFIGDMTFMDVYDYNKWNLNITVTEGDNLDQSKLLNYLTTPNVLVWSAVIASSAIPGFFAGVQLMAKDSQGKIQPYYMTNHI